MVRQIGNLTIYRCRLCEWQVGGTNTWMVQFSIQLHWLMGCLKGDRNEIMDEICKRKPVASVGTERQRYVM